VVVVRESMLSSARAQPEAPALLAFNALKQCGFQRYLAEYSTQHGPALFNPTLRMQESRAAENSAAI
jgi:hypothetical protein